MALNLKIVTPERVVYEEEVDSVSLPALDGEITVLPGHIPLVSLLHHGVVTTRKNGEENFLSLSGGFVEVLPGSKVVVLADTSERSEELELEAVEAAVRRAEEVLKRREYADESGEAAAFGSLERELARMRAIGKKNMRHGHRGIETTDK